MIFRTAKKASDGCCANGILCVHRFASLWNIMLIFIIFPYHTSWARAVRCRIVKAGYARYYIEFAETFCVLIVCSWNMQKRNKAHTLAYTCNAYITSVFVLYVNIHKWNIVDLHFYFILDERYCVLSFLHWWISPVMTWIGNGIWTVSQ